ncbi:MAG: aldehyde dehydrogenase, partial [Deltaproteobacteria bacterium]|nr:aldehyde dehydrogenase [Deltaproteobacteria bacterium]
MENTMISYDPSNGERLGQVRATAIEQIPEVVKKAKKAAESWKILELDERLKIIEQAYAQAEPRINELAELLSREMGKDIQRSSGEVNQPKQAGNGTIIEYRPLGVAAVISPWNYPLAMANNLIVPALVAGNTVVFKPSEETPLVADAFVKILNQKLPEGVLQIIYGDGDQGKALVESQVNLIAFTGSQAVGKDIMARAAGGLKRLVMELGGNDPMIVLEDADISTAARFAVASSFENAGQMCTSTERIYVNKVIADTFEKQVVEVASRYKTGPWNMPGVNIGPIINPDQHAKIIDHIRDAESKGARILLGGSQQPERYIQPTVIADLTPEMIMEQEETFGPVVAMSRYTNLEEAVQRANNSVYGL